MSVSTNRKFVILPSLQRVSGDPYGVAKRDLRPTFEVVEGGKALLVRNLHGRCEQKFVAIWRPGLVRGTWKTLGDVLIQPETMRPAVVAKCDSLYTLAVRLPDDASTEPGGLRVYERGDAYAEPGGRAPGFREVRARGEGENLSVQASTEHVTAGVTLPHWNPGWVQAYDHIYVWDGARWKLESATDVTDGSQLGSEGYALDYWPYNDVLKRPAPPFRAIIRHYLAKKEGKPFWQYLGTQTNYEGRR